jgi:hypothetical protein
MNNSSLNSREQAAIGTDRRERKKKCMETVDDEEQE